MLYELWKFAYTEAQLAKPDEEQTKSFLENMIECLKAFFADPELRPRTCALMRELTKFFAKESNNMNNIIKQEEEQVMPQ